MVDDGQRPLSTWLASWRHASRARHTIAFGALLATMGIGLAGSTMRVVGGALLVLGWLALAVGIHAFGRRGAR